MTRFRLWKPTCKLPTVWWGRSSTLTRFFVPEGRSRNKNMFQQVESYLARILYLGMFSGQVFSLLQSGLCMSTDHSISTYQTVIHTQNDLLNWFLLCPRGEENASDQYCHPYSMPPLECSEWKFPCPPKRAKSRPTIAAVPSCASDCHKPQAVASLLPHCKSWFSDAYCSLFDCASSGTSLEVSQSVANSDGLFLMMRDCKE